MKLMPRQDTAGGTLAMQRSRAARQQGQALAEGLLVLLVAGLLWFAIVQIAQLQDMAMQAQTASRVAAFAAAHDTLQTDLRAVRQTHFAGGAHRWRDAVGKPMLPDPDAQLDLRLRRLAPLPDQAQAGASHADAVQIRREWRLQDAGLVRADVGVPVRVPFQDEASMTIRRHTAILRDAGHSTDDASAQRRVGESARAWGDAVHPSQVAGRRTQSLAQALDAAWGRPAPSYDWLMPWTGAVPGQVRHD